ncbi:MAG: ATP/GTP-binding protein [Candidatus Poseidoniaceae archaeon]
MSGSTGASIGGASGSAAIGGIGGMPGGAGGASISGIGGAGGASISGIGGIGGMPGGAGGASISGIGGAGGASISGIGGIGGMPGGAGGASISGIGGAGGASISGIGGIGGMPGGAGGASISGIGGAGGASISGIGGIGGKPGGAGGASIGGIAGMPGGAGGASIAGIGGIGGIPGGAGGASIEGIGGIGGRPGGAGGAPSAGGAGGIGGIGGIAGIPGGIGGFSSLIYNSSVASAQGGINSIPKEHITVLPFGFRECCCFGRQLSRPIRTLDVGWGGGASMVGMDSGTPPVLFVVGTAGAGKSSLVTSFQRWSRFLETDAIAVNLDPGAERVHYDAEFDVRDLISLTEVMGEYDLGPNGAQILAADLLAAQAGDVAAQLHALSGEVMIVDTPGQVELFAFREASNHLIEVIGREQSAIIYLFDPMLSRSPSGFVSQMLLSSIVEFRLGLPTKNFLSKADLLEPDELAQILEWSERLEILEMALYDEAGGQRTEFAINQLRMMQEFAQAPGLTPLSSELEEGLADILTFAQALFGGMSDARDGFAADNDDEKN